VSRPDVAIEGVAQHRLRDAAHLRDVDELLDRRVRRVALGGLGDVDGQVADAFEVGVDLDRRHNAAEIHGHRLVEGEQAEAAAVDLDVQLVDRFVPAKHPFDELDVARHQAVHGRSHPLFCEPAHCEEAALQRLEFFLKMPDHSFHGCRLLFRAFESITRIGR
jgi:hypothetical protein